MPAASYTGGIYSQDFDNLLATVPANNTTQPATVLPIGWTFVEAGTNANTTLRVDNGASGTGDTFLYGATGSNERALGSYASGSLTSIFGLEIVNDTGNTLTQFTLSYTGEQWKDGGSTNAVNNTLAFSYGTANTSITNGTFTSATQLDFTAPVGNTTSDVTLNGNLAANQSSPSVTVTGINWLSGQSLWLRWSDINDAGNDDGLAIDNISFSASGTPVTPTVDLSVSSNVGTEAGTTVITVTATASSAVSGNQTVNLGVSGTNITAGDYTLSNNVIAIANGQTTGSVNFTIVDDALPEGVETATLTISNPSAGITLGSTTSQDITITDNDSSIQITEYMYNPTNAAVSGEFVEFTNLGTNAVDFTGWSFDDNTRTPGSFSLSAFGVVQAGESVIVTESDADAFRAAWNLSSTVKVIGGLDQNLGRADEINIYDAANNLVDRLTYDDQTIAGTIRTQGKSGWTTVGNLAATTINAGWQLAAVNDAQNSQTSSGGDIGNPGIYNLNPGVNIFESAGSTNIVEGGATDSYKIVLKTQPTANVTISINAGNQTTTNTSTLTFTAANWNVPQTVTVTAIDDAIGEGNHTGIISHTVTSSDANYNGISIASVTADITDNDVSVAPTIQEATATTFLNLPATGSGTVSGVISDPTDPAKTLGIDFNIADADTPIGNLTVTATSNNQSVVTDGNLNLTGTGASRNLKIDPVGVGLAVITVTVSDGINNTTYTINYAASAASNNPSTSRFLTGASNASTAIVINSNYMLVGDDENQALRLYDRTNSGLPVNSFDYTASLGLTDISGGVPREVDIEASTIVGNRIFWMGSQSNNDDGNNRPNRDRIFATDITGTGANTTLSYVGRYDFLKEDIIAWDVNNGHGKGANYYGLAASAAAGISSKINSGYNIEGLEMAPDNTTAYVAFRAPQEPTGTRTKALIVPVTNFTSLLSANGGIQGTATFGAPIELDLGGRGIREIRKNASNQYVIIAGPADSATGFAPSDFRLYTWTGIPTDAPILRAADLTSLNVDGSFESIVEVPDSLTSNSQLQLLVDNGDTVYYNNGQAAKDITANYQKSRSEIVTLGNAIVSLPTGTISLNTLYSQNFDSLSSTNTTWTDTTNLTGWYAAYANTTLTTINAGTGSSSAGSLYSFGAAGNVERALGSTSSGTPGTIFYGARFFNDTGATISSLSVSYVGEQWRNGGNTTPQKLDFAYQIGATDIQSGTWTDVDSLDFTSPIATATAGALDGNANSVNLSSAFTGFSLAAGQEIWLRWSDINDAGNDHGLGIDNLQVSTSALPGVSIVQSGGNTNVTEGGATDTYTVVLNTQPTANVSITITPDSQTTTSVTSLIFTTANWNIAQTVTVTAVDDTAIEGTHNGIISHTAASTDTSYNGISISSVTATITDNDVASVITKIHDIQGSGATAALTGTQTIEGIVTRAFQGATKLNGFYVQEEDADADGNSATSEAIFVYDPTGLFSGYIGDKVRVTGTVKEFTSTSNGNNSSLTELDITTGTVLNLGASTLPTVTNIQLPVTSVSDLERYEGMLVNISAGSGNLTVTENYQLGRYGQVVLAADGSSNQPGTDSRLDQYTQFNAPSVSGYAAYLAEIATRKIYLDDGSGSQNLDPTIFARGGNPLSATNTLRSGDSVASITGVLDERFEGYRIQTSTGVDFTPTNPRPDTPPVVGGTLKVASFNVLNYFNDLDTNVNITTNGLTFEPRGANTAAEFTRQRDKIIQAIINSGADVLGLMELENNGYGTNSAIQDLVNGLNAVAGAGTYSFINPGTRLGTDAIAVGLIYKPGKVTPVGAAATMPDGYGTGAFNLVGRKPLAQTFQQISTGEQFTAVVNHFKSKGSSSGGVGDADAGDGQGFSNGTRTRQAQDLTTWLATQPTGTTDADYLLLGDFNAYAQEDPITTLASAGYSNLLPNTSYSYVFDGQVGALDHALGSSNLVAQVTGAEKWHINADEPSVLDYNTEFKSANQVSSLYNADQFRASDHDPVIVGLNLYTAQNPTNINLSSSSVNENVPIGTLVGTFSTIDPNVGDTFTYSLVTGTSSTDNSVFTISGNQLQINSSPNFETKSSYNILVETQDQGGLSYQKALTININDVNEAPVVANPISTQTIVEGSPLSFQFANNTFTDVDAGTSFSYSATLVNGNPLPAWLSFNSSTRTFAGTPSVTAVGTLNLKVTASDGSLNATNNFDLVVLPTIQVNNVSLNEGNSGTSIAQFNVSLSAASNSVVSVNYATADGTAVSGTDYNATSGTLTFAPGQTTQIVNVGVLGDVFPEGDETFQLQLSNPNNAGIKIAQGIGTILNDDTNSGLNITGSNRSDILLGGKDDDTISGLNGDDIILGLNGSDRLKGGLGGDILTGGNGADFFIYPALSDSLLANSDLILDFNPQEGDRFVLNNLPIAVFNAGVLSRNTYSTLNAAINAVYTDANPTTAGNQALGVNQAIFFGWNQNTYLSVNDGVSGFNANSDLLVQFLGILNPLPTGTLAPNNYFTV